MPQVSWRKQPSMNPVQLPQDNQDSTETTSDLRTRPGRQKPLRALCDLQRLRGLESLPKDGAPGRYLRDGIGVDYVPAVGQRVAKRNLNVGRAGFEQEMLVANSGCSSVVGDGHDDYGQIEGITRAVGDLDGSVDPVVADPGRLKPFEQQRSGDDQPELF